MECAVKFIFIAICFYISLRTLKNPINIKDGLLLTAGMFFTLISDFSLLILKNHHLGVFTFCFTHIAYILRNGGRRSLKVYTALAAVCFTFGYISAGLLEALGAAYACLFFLDLHMARRSQLPKANRRLMLFGLVLFALCDINILLFNLRFYLKNSIITETVSPAALKLAWVFYTPSQLALALSGINFQERRWKI